VGSSLWFAHDVGRTMVTCDCHRGCFQIVSNFHSIQHTTFGLSRHGRFNQVCKTSDAAKHLQRAGTLLVQACEAR
jgi:hypothetical protein